MLLLLLLVSSGCDVNIPGCGKRSLPFFKPVTPPAVPTAAVANTILPVSTPLAQAAISKPAAKPQVAAPAAVEMNLNKPAPTLTPTFTATPEEIEKIAYTTLEQGKPTLWTMNTDGTGRTRLTGLGSSSWYPLWSPNGKSLAFLSDMKDGKINLFMVQKDGSNLQQLTALGDMPLPFPSQLKPPFSWSPKSDEIVYGYHNQVWKVNLETLAQQTLDSEDGTYSISQVEWAPHRDNKYVAFVVSQGPGYGNLKLVNPRLKDLLTLTSLNQTIVDMSWTSDAREVAYLVDNTLYTASPQTSLPKLVLDHPCTEMGPLVSYSPSETASVLMLLAKEFKSDKAYRVAVMEKASAGFPDPGTLKYLTPDGVDDAIWSPDGSKIAYVQAGDLWVMDSNGANPHRIALIGIQSPVWSRK